TDRYGEGGPKCLNRPQVQLLERRRVARDAVEQGKGTAVLLTMPLDRRRDFGEGRHPGRHDRWKPGVRDGGHKVGIRYLPAWDLHDLDPELHEARNALRIERRGKSHDPE